VASLGSLALGLFVLIERGVRWPLVDLSLFRRRRFVALAGLAAVCNAAYGVMIFGVTLYLQTARGFSPLAAGVMFLGPSLAAALAGPLSGVLGARLTPISVLARGIVTGGVALLALAAVRPVGPFLEILTLSGRGFGLVYAYANVATQETVPAHQAGAASGVVLTCSSLWPAWESSSPEPGSTPPLRAAQQPELRSEPYSRCSRCCH
jgi:Major Facilitator Superfamily